MEFVCKYCGHLNEVELHSGEQNKKYLNLEKEIKKLESEAKEINKDCIEELERRKEEMNKFYILCIGIGAGVYILGWVPNISLILKVSLWTVGLALAVSGFVNYLFRAKHRLDYTDFERIFKEKYPERAESKDFQIRSKEIEPSSKYYGELTKQKWNCSFICLFCGEQSRFWKES